jgi:hypothetical protein
MIAIYADRGGEFRPDEFGPVALYDDGEWLAGGDEWEPYYPSGTPEAEIGAQLDGPDPVAVEVTEGPDELLAAIEKTTDSEPVDAPTTSTTERNNDGHEGNDGTAPFWARSDDDEEKNSQSIGPTQSTLMGVGDDVTVVDDEDDPEDDEP